jgi:hypothetical protein
VLLNLLGKSGVEDQHRESDVQNYAPGKNCGISPAIFDESQHG